MKLTNLFLALACLVIVSCGQSDPNKQVDEGNVKGTIYESKELGWSIEIPKGWTIVSKDKTEASEQKGKDAIEQVSDVKIDTKALKNLISFQKDQFNIFGSTTEPFKETMPGDYQKACRALNELIYKTYTGQGIKTDSSSGKEIVQGMEFNAFYITIYAPEGKVILNQILYSRLINGLDFGVNINYNNDQDKKTMIDAFHNSKFIQK